MYCKVPILNHIFVSSNEQRAERQNTKRKDKLKDKTMTTRRTVDSKAGTLKKMSKMTVRTAVTNFFTFTAISLLAAGTMSFVQKDDSAKKGCCTAIAETTASKVIVAVSPKTDMNNEWVTTLRNIKKEVSRADKEVNNSLLLAEVAKKQAVVFYQNAMANMQMATEEVENNMAQLAFKNSFTNGNAAVVNESAEEVNSHMQNAAVKKVVDEAMKTDLLSADEEVKAGVIQASPETALNNFIKGNKKTVADADAEITQQLSTKNTIVKKG